MPGKMTNLVPMTEYHCFLNKENISFPNPEAVTAIKIFLVLL